jgi:hypothetical protein
VLSASCMMGAFETWIREPPRNLSLPLPPEDFYSQLWPFLYEQPAWLSLMAIEEDLSFSGGGSTEAAAPPPPLRWRIRTLAAKFVIEVENHAPASTRRVHFDLWEDEVVRLNAAAPPSAKHAVQSAGAHWLTMAVLEVLLSTAVLVITTSIIVGFVFVLCTTCSLRIALVCTATILALLTTWGGIAVSSGILSQGLGMVESLVVMVSVGLVLDPITHVAFAYAEATDTTQEARLSRALSTIGISVLAGGISTSGACAILLFTTIVLFSRFALLFCTLMILALVFTNFFLAPLLLIFGPRGTGRRLLSRVGVSSWRVAAVLAWRERGSSRSQRHTLRQSDSAAHAHAVELEIAPATSGT